MYFLLTVANMFWFSSKKYGLKYMMGIDFIYVTHTAAFEFTPSLWKQ